MSSPSSKALRTAALVSLCGLAAGCGVNGAPTRPDVAAVRTQLAEGYVEPERLTVAPVNVGAEGRPDVVAWERRYDGVPMLGRPKSAWVGSKGWELRRYHELEPPQPVQRAKLISDRVAIAAAKIDTSDGDEVTTRLVYLPEHQQRPLRGLVQNAADVELVVARHRLVTEVTNARSGDVVWVDAYSGEVVRRGSLDKADQVAVTGAFYGSYYLDVTGPLLRDPIRSSLVDGSGTAVGGQGVLSSRPSKLEDATTFNYQTRATADPALLDVQFALTQSWNYYLFTFGRRGLRDLPKDASSTKNDAVAYLDFSQTTSNAKMRGTTGVIRIHAGHPAWRADTTLDTLGHEWTHGVFNDEVNSDIAFYIGENGGIDEANSDFFGLSVRSRGRMVLASGGVDTGLPGPSIPNAAGDWVFGNEHPLTPPSDYKHLCRPSRNSTTARERWAIGIGTDDPHDSAGVMWRVFCLLSRGVAPIAATGVDPDLQVAKIPNGFPGLGSAAVAALWYRTLKLLGGQPDPVQFIQARVSMLVVAEEVYGLDTPQYKAIEDAFAAVDVGSPSDHDAPSVDVVVTRARPGGSFELLATDHDGIGSLVCSFDGAPPFANLASPPPTPLKGPYNVTVPSSLITGPHVLTVVAKDIHGNEQTYTFIITIESEGPLLTALDETATLKAGPNPLLRVFNFGATDPAGIQRVRLLIDGVESVEPSSRNGGQGGPSRYTYAPISQGGSTTVSEVHQWVVLKDLATGRHVITIEATDYAGNVSTAELPEAVRDRTPPSPCSVVGLGRSFSWDLITVGVNAADTGSGIALVKYYVDGTLRFVERAFDPTSAPTLQVTAGTHAFRVECTDQQSNTAASNTLSIVVGPPPVCSVNSAGSDATIPTRINMSVTAKSPTATLKSVFYEVNGVVVGSEVNLNLGPGVVFQKTRQANLSAGTYQVRARCQDSLGQETLSNVVTVNHQPPMTPPTEPTCDAVLNSGGPLPETFTIDVKKTSGFVDLSYNTLDVDDELVLTCEGVGTIGGAGFGTTGCVATEGWTTSQQIPFSCSTTRIRVQVLPNCAGSGETKWHFQLGCGY